MVKVLRNGIVGVTSPEVAPSFGIIGYLAKGAMVDNKMVENPEFRFTSQNEAAVSTFLEAYGDKPTSIEVAFPFASVYDVFWSTMAVKGKGGKFNQKCDGQTIYMKRDQKGNPVNCEHMCMSLAAQLARGVSRAEAEKKACQCKPTATLKFILLSPDGQRSLFGYQLVVANLSEIDFSGEGKIFSTLLGQMQIYGSLAGLRATLYRKEITLTNHFNKKTWPIQVTYHMKDATAMLNATSTSPALPSGLDDDEGSSDNDNDNEPAGDTTLSFLADSLILTTNKNNLVQVKVQVDGETWAYCTGELAVNTALLDGDHLYDTGNWQFDGSVHVFDAHGEPRMRIEAELKQLAGKTFYAITKMEPDAEWLDRFNAEHADAAGETPADEDEYTGELPDDDFEDAEPLPTFTEMGIEKQGAITLTSELMAVGKYDEGYNLLFQQWLIGNKTGLDFKKSRLILQEQGILPKDKPTLGKKASAPTNKGK